MDRPRRELQDNVLNRENIVLNLSRIVKLPDWKHALVSDVPCTAISMDINGSYCFPLFIYRKYIDIGFLTELHPINANGSIPNISRGFFNYFDLLTNKSATTIDMAHAVMHYCYAIFYSSKYRTRYYGFLRNDFPHIPLPKSKNLLASLSNLGADLVALHLLKLDYSYASWNATLSKKESLLKSTKVTFNNSGFCDIPKGYPKYESGTVFINPNESGFKNVPSDVWNFHIGGYQVCEKWLKDRRGRTLTDEDVEHYQKIVVAIKETIRLMREIDKVIEEHGGFPGAFVTDPKIIEEAKAKAQTTSPF